MSKADLRLKNQFGKQTKNGKFSVRQDLINKNGYVNRERIESLSAKVQGLRYPLFFRLSVIFKVKKCCKQQVHFCFVGKNLAERGSILSRLAAGDCVRTQSPAVKKDLLLL